MKKILFIIPILFLACSNDNKDNQITISKSEYQKLIGDTIKPKYPKTININHNNSNYRKSFEFYLGSDGHEYTSDYRGYWFHYGGCELCKQKYDSLIYYIKRKNND